MSNSCRLASIPAQNSRPNVPITAQFVNSYQSAKFTSDLFCLSNSKECIDFKLLLLYLDKPDYAIYCKKYSNLCKICKNPNACQQQQNAIRVKDTVC